MGLNDRRYIYTPVSEVFIHYIHNNVGDVKSVEAAPNFSSARSEQNKRNSGSLSGHESQTKPIAHTLKIEEYAWYLKSIYKAKALVSSSEDLCPPPVTDKTLRQ